LPPLPGVCEIGYIDIYWPSLRWVLRRRERTWRRVATVTRLTSGSGYNPQPCRVERQARGAHHECRGARGEPAVAQRAERQQRGEADTPDVRGVGNPLTPGCQIRYADHPGCRRLVSATIRPTSGVGNPLTPGCQIRYADHPGCRQLVSAPIRPTSVEPLPGVTTIQINPKQSKIQKKTSWLSSTWCLNAKDRGEESPPHHVAGGAEDGGGDGRRRGGHERALQAVAMQLGMWKANFEKTKECTGDRSLFVRSRVSQTGRSSDGA
jgi:hypothetical protein